MVDKLNVLNHFIGLHLKNNHETIFVNNKYQLLDEKEHEINVLKALKVKIFYCYLLHLHYNPAFFVFMGFEEKCFFKALVGEE